MIAEIVQITRTAAAAKSFTCPAFSFRPGDNKSTLISMEVLISSAAITDPIQSKTMHHSRADKWRIIAEIITTEAAIL